MSKNKRFHKVLVDKWPIILALLIFVAFTFAGCQQFLQQNPIAVISATPTSGTPPLDVSFDGTGSSDPDGTIATYAWAFGDGDTATGATQTHTYTTEGTYTATLTVTDNDGLTDTDSVSITVSTAPTAEYIYFASERSPYNIYRMDTDGSNQAQVTSSTVGVDNLFPSLPYDTRSKLAFASDRDDGSSGGNNKFDIFKSEVDGTLPVNLTSQTAYSQIEPSWNNDGSKIAYASNETGDWEIWVMNNDGSSVTQLTNQTASTELAPAFSPDGAKIVYVSDSGDSNDPALWIMDSDGTDKNKIYDSSGKDGAIGPNILSIFTSPFGMSTPSWSPDGTKIAFASDKATSGSVDIYICNYDSSANECSSVTSTAADDSAYDEFAPFWLPSSDYIAYVADSDSDGNYEIWRLEVGGTDKDKLADIGTNISPADELWNN